MDAFAAFGTLLLVGIPIGWVLYRDQRDYNKRRTGHRSNASPAAPLLIKARRRWTVALPRIRAIILDELHFKNEAGETVRVDYNSLIHLEWHQLEAGLQSLLVTLEGFLELDPTIQDRIRCKAAKPPDVELVSVDEDYPTADQIKEMWDAYQRNEPGTMEGVLRQRAAEHAEVGSDSWEHSDHQEEPNDPFPNLESHIAQVREAAEDTRYAQLKEEIRILEGVKSGLLPESELEKINAAMPKVYSWNIEGIADKAARAVAASFSEAIYRKLFDDQRPKPQPGSDTMPGGSTVSDALAIWYSLGHLCFMVSVNAIETKPKLASAILDSEFERLIKSWDMPKQTYVKFHSFNQENLRQIMAEYNAAVSQDPPNLRVLFNHFVSAILGYQVSFSDRTLGESLLRGRRVNEDIALTTAVGILFVDTMVESGKIVGVVDSGQGR